MNNNNVRAINTVANISNLAEQTQEAAHAGLVGFEKTVSAINNGAGAAGAAFEATQAQMKQGMEKAMKTAEELAAFNQGNYEALVKSTQIWFAGLQDLTKQMAATAQAQFEDAMATAKTIGTFKSVKEAVDLQTSFARNAVEKAMTDTGRIADASMKLAEQTIAPLSARVTLAVEKFGKPV